MAQRLHKTLVDYLVIAISPALIMTLIGSLVFFLIEVFYRGPFEARLKYVFTLYVFAAVLVGRIAIEEGKERARLFAVPLAIAAFVVLLRFVESTGPLSLILILVILWCADKLTWDCTVIDERQRDTGKGLLQVAGLDRPKASRTPSDAEEPAEKKLEGVTSRDAATATWWKRLIERQRRPHAPGVWVVYFSLAALPLFGIGQLLIPPGNLAERQYAFCLLLIYVASGLGLLLATSFLGLRRYLRQRRVEMPTVMASVWLAIGCILIAVLLTFAALLPRPNAEYDVSRLPFTIGSRRQEPSRHAPGTDGVESDQAELHSAEVDQESEPAPTEDTGKNGGESGKQDENAKSNAEGQDGKNHSQPAREEEPEEPPKDPSTDSRTRPQDSPQAEERSPGRDAADGTRRPQSETEPARDRASDPQRQPAPRPQNFMRGISREVAALLKWVFYAALVLIGIYWLWRSRAEVLAALRGLLQGWRAFWQNLFGRKRKQAGETAGAEQSLKQPVPRPFADFTDPFAAGTAGRYSPDELVRYSFEALEAWAREHGCPRQPEQTPHEFARNVGTRMASLSRNARKLADLYCRAAYLPSAGHPDALPNGRGTLPAASLGPLRQLWQQLRSAVVTPTGIPGQ